jgi:ribonuclease P protein component
MGLPRQLRLNNKGVFNRILKSPRLAICKVGIVLGLPKLPQHQHLPTQIGLVVSKKVHKRANKRNKLRRQCAAILQQYLTDTPQMHQYRAWVIVLRAEVLELTFQDIHNELIKALHHALKKPLRLPPQPAKPSSVPL